VIEIHFSKVPLPCPANRLHGVMNIRKGGRFIPMKVLSKEARIKRDLVVADLLRQMGGTPPRLSRPVTISFSVTPRDKRTPDWDAYTTQLCDCLQKAGVVVDDKLIAMGSGERMPNSCRPGWIDITITELP
jgi:Holliday junction resolvase RusA-like endonuclease